MKGKLFFLIVVCALTVLLVAGCSTLQPSSGGDTNNYFPNTDGYTWRYSTSDGSSQVMTFEGTIQIGSTTVQIFKVRYTYPSRSASTAESYMKVDSSGVYYYPSLTTTEAYTFLSYPLEVGKNWIYYDLGPNSYSSRATVAAQEDVTVSAGTFNCYKITFAYLRGTVEVGSSNIWFGKNVGMVKTTTSSTTYETQLVWKSF